MKRVAIPISKGHLSEFFGQCHHYEIFDIEEMEIKSNTLELPPLKDIEKLPDWAASQGITDVIAYKVDKRILSLFAGNKINLFVGVNVDKPAILIDQYLSGTLKSNLNVVEEIIQKS